MNKTRRIVEISVILLVLTFIIYQFFASYYSAITTESAVFFQHSEGIELNGTIIRNEHLVEKTGSGTIHYVISDGERVSKGGTIARLYTDEKASAAAVRIDEIDSQLEIIKEMEDYGDSATVDLGTINAKINESVNDFLYSLTDNSYDESGALKTKMLTALMKKQIATGEKIDFSDLKSELSTERENLVSVMGTPKSEYVSGYAGYFVSSTDGYEGNLSSKDLSVYTPEYLDSLKPSSDNDSIGKIVYDYEWYVAATIPVGDAMNYKIGETVKLNIEAAGQTVSATIKKINYSESDTASVIFSCNEMSSELASIRSGKIIVIKDEYSGLKVSSRSIRTVNGVRGVYVVSGIEIKFVEVEILFSNEEYTICKLNTSDGSKLRLYDEVVVKGRGLYDGKIIY